MNCFKIDSGKCPESIGTLEDSQSRGSIGSELSDLSAEINRCHYQCERSSTSVIDAAKLAGYALLDAKSKVRHRGWAEWVNAHCDCGKRTSRMYMTVARNWEKSQAKRTRASEMSLREAARLLDEPPAHRSSQSSEWNTPLKIVEAAVKVLNEITLDP